MQLNFCCISNYNLATLKDYYQINEVFNLNISSEVSLDDVDLEIIISDHNNIKQNEDGSFTALKEGLTRIIVMSPNGVSSYIDILVKSDAKPLNPLIIILPISIVILTGGLIFYFFNRKKGVKG